MKTSETIQTRHLAGPVLDWAVATALGHKVTVGADGLVWLVSAMGHTSRSFNPSSNWTWAGPVLESERIEIRYRPRPWDDVEATSTAGTRLNEFGPTPLVAGLRAVVASKLGPEVSIPRELLA